MPGWCPEPDCLEIIKPCDSKGNCPNCGKNCTFQLNKIERLLYIILETLEHTDHFTNEEKNKLAVEFAQVLSRSDHLPVTKKIQINNRDYTVYTHNIQEFCKDGLNIYVDGIIKEYLPELSKKERKSLKSVFMEIMMNDIVLETQQQNVINWIKECTDSNTNSFVCLQEITLHMREFLSRSWNSLTHRIYFSNTEPESETETEIDADKCVGITAIIYPKQKDIIEKRFNIIFKLPNGRERIRTFASVIFGDMMVSSVHILHTSDNNIYNYKNLIEGLKQITTELSNSEYEKINSVILAGDFNCNFAANSDIFSDLSITSKSYINNNELKICSWQPKEPTQNGKNKEGDNRIVDGLLAITKNETIFSSE